MNKCISYLLIMSAIILAGCVPSKNQPGFKSPNTETMMEDIQYTRDTKTDLCFAIVYPITNANVMTNVPCDKVEKFLK